jgi:hypothetical protein
MPEPSIHSGLKLEEVLPHSMDHVSGVTTSTALVQRKRLRLVPQTAASGVGPGSMINFLIQDPGFLDLRSAVLHANITLATPSGTGSVSLDDGPSWLRQMVIQVDGQNVETQNYVNKLTNMETYMTCSPALYNRALSFAGYWKFSPDLAKANSQAGGSVYQFQDVSANAIAAEELYIQTATTPNGWDIAVPLGLVSHFFRCEKYFPSRFANNLFIQLQLESAVAAIFGTGSRTSASYTLNNIYLNIDTVTLNPSFTAFLQDEVMKPGGAGITLPVNTKISATGQSQAPGDNTFVVSRASKNLRRVAVAQQPTAVLNAASTAYPECSTFASAGFANDGQVQLYIAGQYYPLFPARGSDAYWVAHQAYNGTPLSDADGGIVNYRTWRTTTGSAGACQANSTKWSDMWIWAYDLSKMVGTSSPLDHDGVDSTGNAQIQVNIKTGTPENGVTENFTPIVELLGTKYINISNGELVVQG